jgi:hypothetical protein
MSALIPVTLPQAFTTHLETHYYGKITELSMLESIVHDPAFLEAPLKHVALFSDHGMDHGRDIAAKIVAVVHQVNGLLIPQRRDSRLEFMVGYGVMLAYLHDIGLKNYSAFGRAIHPEFAAQLIFTPEFDPLIEALWRENTGGVAWRLLNLAIAGQLPNDPRLVLRELLALAMGHSKTKVPMAVLNHWPTLRQRMQTAVGTELHYLYQQQQVEKLEKRLAHVDPDDQEAVIELSHKLEQAQQALDQFKADRNPEDLLNLQARSHYANFETHAFTWLTGTDPEVQELGLDVVDTMRSLRCADAFRERGTTFQTSAGYEVFVNQENAHAVYALRSQDQTQLFLLEGKDPISAGEANMTGADLDHDGNLRVSFARGAFATPEAERWAAYSAAVVINDVQADVIESFRRGSEPSHFLPPATKLEQDMQILIEDTEDNLEFGELVSEELLKLNPNLRDRVVPVISLQGADLLEVQRYVAGTQVNWSLAEKQTVLNQITELGPKAAQINLDKAFQEVRRIQLQVGDVLYKSGTAAWFIYIPFTPGLQVFPDRATVPYPISPWSLVGVIDLLRGSLRDSRVVTGQTVELLMIPKEIYLKYWYLPYDIQEFTTLCHSREIHQQLGLESQE